MRVEQHASNESAPARAGRARLAASLAAMGVATLAHAQTRIYVDASAPPGGDGTSWATAYRDLQVALHQAERTTPRYSTETPQATIALAKGTYRPGASSFQVSLGSGLSVTIQGGYAGRSATNPDEFDYTTVETVITADRLGDDGPNFGRREDNTYAALVVSGTARLPRTIQLNVSNVRFAGGQSCAITAFGGWGYPLSEGLKFFADRCEFVDSGGPLLGGGLQFDHCDVSLMSCTISGNHSDSVGGGILSQDGGRLMLSGCVVAGNQANFGGGIGCQGIEFCSINGSTISGNRASVGGGIAMLGGVDLGVHRSSVVGNTAVTRGGGISTESPSNLNTVLLADNTAGVAAGGAIISGSVRMCTIAGNHAPVTAGVHFSSAFSTLAGSIVASNGGGAQVSIDLAPLFIADSLLEGGASAILNPFATPVAHTLVYTDDPRFVAPRGGDGDPATWSDNDYHLRADSPAIDRVMGDPWAADLDARSRAIPAYAGGFELSDLGCYELPTRVCAADLDDGSGLGRRDEAVTVDDLVMYMAAFNAGGLLADLDDGTGRGFPDRSVTVDDLVYFLAAFASGC